MLWALLLLLALALPVQAQVPIQAPAAVVMDAETGQVLLAKNMHEQRAPASLTKILTALLVLEMPHDQRVVTVSRSAARMPGATTYLRPGQQVLTESMLIGMFFRSGNDAAVALAEHYAGSIASFTQVMNQKAREIGMYNSNFRNPHGLDEDGHYSTAYDLALLTRRALENRRFAELARTNYQKVRWSGQTVDMWNINSFLWRYDGASGVKTGYTSRAGYCLAASAHKEGRTLILVLLGAATSNQRWRDAIRWLDYAFANYDSLKAGEESEAEASPRTYRVKVGDCLSHIALKFATTVEQLAHINGLANPDLIRVGQVLKLP